ncbi:MAG: hypothetical protein ACOVOX_18455 [Burkholderiaceae bacterium]
MAGVQATADSIGDRRQGSLDNLSAVLQDNTKDSSEKGAAVLMANAKVEDSNSEIDIFKKVVKFGQ